jgi:hypothetical protein
MTDKDPYNMQDKKIDELLRIICDRVPDALDHQHALVEIRRREHQDQNNKAEKRHEQIHARLIDLKKPHWSLTPVFIVTTLAMLFAAIAAWPVIREWIQSSPPMHISSSSQSPQQYLKTKTQGEQKK